MAKIYDFKTLGNKGAEVDFAQFQGKVLLIVNTASKCGFTPQFDGLEELNEKYRERGLVMLGFPCNQFANQDPGTDSEITEFCRVNYGVTFQMMKKIDVNGKDAPNIYGKDLRLFEIRAKIRNYDPNEAVGKVKEVY